jgi:eukaryotic-like serine/threonine-protein kinase
MSDPSTERDPLEALAAEFVERQRRGENPSVPEYAARHPELADEIRDLFPTIVAMERLKVHQEQSGTGRASLGDITLERLGDFRIIRELGRGGMGIVYEAEQESLGRRVAVKVLPRQSLLEPKHVHRFQREAQAAARLHHTNIVPVFGVGEQEGFHYYVMQLIRGVGLDEILSYMRRKTPPGKPASGSEHDLPTYREGLTARIGRTLLSGSVGRPRTDTTAVIDVQRPDDPSTPGDASSVQNPPSAPSDKTTGATAARPGDVAIASQAGPASDRLSAQMGSIQEALTGSAYWVSVARIGIQAADALDYAHRQGTLHRDIKPGNLLLDSQGVTWVADFGLAKILQSQDMSQTADITGTLPYMAPEQFSGQTDARSDIYSLGLTLYELLTLQRAYDDSDRSRLIRRITEGELAHPRKLNSQIPADLETIVVKAAAPDPGSRYQSARELAADLQCFLEDRPIRARRATSIERLWRWYRRNRAVASLATLALTLLVLVAVVATVGFVQTRKALEGQARQRDKAEANADLALQALDRIFERFSPRQSSPALEMTLGGARNVVVQVATPPVLSKEAAALLEDMLPFYDRLAKQVTNEAEVLEKVARANRRVGDIRQRLGQYDEAVAAYSRAIEVYEQLGRPRPQETHVPLEIARIRNELGGLFRSTQRFADAQRSHVTALTILHSVSKGQQNRPETRYELARTCYFLGMRPRPEPGAERPGPPRNRRPPPEESTDGEAGGVRPPSPQRPPPVPDEPRSQEDRRQQDECMAKAIDLLNRLIEEYPSKPDYRHMLALCHRDRSIELERRDRAAGKLALDKATKLLEQLVADFPEVQDYRYDLSETYAAVDPHHAPPSDRTDAETAERLRKALRLSEKLGAENPYVPQYMASQAHLHHQLTAVLTRMREWDKAEQSHRRAIDIQTSLVEQFPEVPSYQLWLGQFRNSLGQFLLERTRLREARVLLDGTATMLTGLMARHPEMEYIHGLLDQTYTTLATVLRRDGQQELALDAERRAAEHRRDSPRAPDQAARESQPSANGPRAR